MNIEILAKHYATAAHASINQKRKYTNEDYIVHPTNVAYLVKLFGGTPEMIAAAYLHDVIEDVYPVNGKGSCIDIERNFGSNVCELVLWLTDESKPSDGNRETRKEIERNKYRDAPPSVKMIKIADLIDNSLTICEFDKGFSKIYLKEKELLLPMLYEDSHHSIYDLARTILLKNKETK